MPGPAELAIVVPAVNEDEFAGGNHGSKGDVPAVRSDCTKIASLSGRYRRNSPAAVGDAMAAMREAIVRG